MKRSRLVVEHDNTINTDAALAAALIVARQGKISMAGGIPHYCWVTQMKSGLQVSSRRKKTATSADVLVVHGPYETVAT